MPNIRDSVTGLICLVMLAMPALAQHSAPKLLEVRLANGQRIAGMPVHWGSVDAAVIEPTGYFHLLDLANVKQHRVLDLPFRPQTLQDARVNLSRELGSSFETIVAGPYVIAAPAGQAAQWQRRFVALYSGYLRYFETRGWAWRPPDFPLVVIVFPSREEFLRYAKLQGGKLPPRAVGSYFPRTNRCILYQIPGRQGTNWNETEATIVHEAVHQLAYNTGAHERLFANPFWFVEGLATMYEQPAVYDLGVSRSTVRSRVLGSKLQRIMPLMEDPSRLTVLVGDLVVRDEMFKQESQLAYALSWGLTFFLHERLPREYGNYIKAQGKRPFGKYTPEERLRDFEASFRMGMPQLANQMARFYQEL